MAASSLKKTSGTRYSAPGLLIYNYNNAIGDGINLDNFLSV